ncbi:MAG: DUF1178 family protein [Pseudomonadota bacterium]
MIRYALVCECGHAFESWFRDSEAYNTLRAAGQITCAACGGTRIEKQVMAPRIGRGAQEKADKTPAPEKAPPSPPAPPVTLPETSPVAAAMQSMRTWVEKNTENVGKNFATEARRIHDGEAEARAIRGEARREEAEALLEDGIAVAPLPWPTRRLS